MVLWRVGLGVVMLAVVAMLVGCQDGMPPMAAPTPQATATATSGPEPSPTPEGGLRLVLQAETLLERLMLPGEMEEAQRILERRLEAMGVSSSSVRVEGSNRLVVELRGSQWGEVDVRGLVRQGLLEIVDGGSEPLTEGYVITTTLGPPTPAQAEAGDTYTGAVDEFQTIISGEDIERDKVEVTQDQAGQPLVAFTLNADGANKLAEFTADNIGNYMPIVLDKMVISSPVIRAAISSREAVISVSSPFP